MLAIGNGFSSGRLLGAALAALAQTSGVYALTSDCFNGRGLSGVVGEPKPFRITHGPVRKGRGGKVKRW
jgi:hypothetical protein